MKLKICPGRIVRYKGIKYAGLLTVLEKRKSKHGKAWLCEREDGYQNTYLEERMIVAR